MHRTLAAGVIATAIHGAAALALLHAPPAPGEAARLRPDLEIELVRTRSAAHGRASGRPAPAQAFATIQTPPSVAIKATPVSPAAPGVADAAGSPAKLAAALRGSLVGCALAQGALADRTLRERCVDRLAARLADARPIPGIAPAKRVLWDEIAWAQDEARAFFHVPTASTAYPHGAGGIAAGPASSEIYAHNVADPSPPKDPLLRRESKSLGPPVP